MAKRRRHTPEFKAEVVLEENPQWSKFTSKHSAGGPHNLSEQQLSKWKQQVVENVASLFTSADQHSSEATERIAQLEQLVGRLTLALEIEKKASTLLE